MAVKTLNRFYGPHKMQLTRCLDEGRNRTERDRQSKAETGDRCGVADLFHFIAVSHLVGHKTFRIAELENI